MLEKVLYHHGFDPRQNHGEQLEELLQKYVIKGFNVWSEMDVGVEGKRRSNRYLKFRNKDNCSLRKKLRNAMTRLCGITQAFDQHAPVTKFVERVETSCKRIGGIRSGHAHACRASS